MEAIAQTRSVYLEAFEASAQAAPAWTATLHRRGIEAFEARGLPGPKEEAWRKTPLAPVTEQSFAVAEGGGAVSPALARKVATLGDGPRLVFVDGVIDTDLSDLGEPGRGLTVVPIGEYADKAPAVLAEGLGERADVAGHPFVALNTAFFRDGAFIHAAHGALPEQPVLVVHIDSGEAEGRAVYPRVLVRAERGAELQVVEHFLGEDGVHGLTAPVTEILADDGAIVDYHRVQEAGDANLHLGAVHIAAARDAHVTAHAFSVGARLARVDVYADIDGTGAEVTLNGLYLTRERQFCDFHTWVTHHSEHGSSRQLFKGVLQGRSETVFDGLVKVAEGAQKTDAQQQNRNLVLDKLALAHSNPRLEIYADDVKCAHGSTVGELDDEALFYLRSRGVGPQDAQGMLTLAYASEMLQPIRLAAVHDHIRGILLERLPGDEIVRSVV
ncbi:Fe-S cluster assembly protein SufD [Arhodomonas sp. AD133]|uniref:Fe-S cluster assembly protein SufD n=1 Tax=Arhodomonas sp. AD133 TaxID=3415009 RepID=UPI003EBCDAF2